MNGDTIPLYVIEMEKDDPDPVRERLAEDIFHNSGYHPGQQWSDQNWAVKSSTRRSADNIIDTVSRAGIGMYVDDDRSGELTDTVVSERVHSQDGMIVLQVDGEQVFIGAGEAELIAKDILTALGRSFNAVREGRDLGIA